MDRRLVRRVATVTGAAFGAVLLLIGTVVLHQRLTGNFHKVIAGQLYRSGQPSASQLESWVRTYGIRTVINLRGANPGKGWYDREVATAAALGLHHIDIKVKSSIPASRELTDRIVEAMRTAPKPILVHCEAGADRTGLAAALYLAAVVDIGEVAADRQLSFIYGHISVWPSAGRRMTQSFEAVKPSLMRAAF